MKNLIGFLSANNGKSFMRLASLMTVCSALIWGFTDVISYLFDKTHVAHTELILGTLGIGLTAKAIQKKYETNTEIPKEPSDNG